MKQSNPSHSPFCSELAWTEAQLRVEAYLRAHRMFDERRVATLAHDIVSIARGQVRPGIAPLTAAMETLEACQRVWLARMTSDEPEGLEERLTRGRLAVAMGEVASRWPEHFLRGTTTPEKLSAVMREVPLSAGPEIKLGHMAPPVEAPRRATPAPRWQAAFRWMIPRLLPSLMVIASLIGVAYAASL